LTKILILASFAPSLRNFRGALIEEMCGRGYTVHAVAPGLDLDQPTKDWLESRGVHCHAVPLLRSGLNPIADLRTVYALMGLMRRICPDLFIGYTVKPVVWGLIAARIVNVRNRVALITGLGYAFTSGASGVRRIVGRLARSLYWIALRQSTLVFFQNPDDRNEFNSLGLLPSRVPVRLVAGSGVDLDHFVLQPLPAPPMRFLLVARLLGDKGIREYVAAARYLHALRPDVEFHLVGGSDSNPNGISEEEATEWSKSGGLVWHGHLSDVRDVLAQAHVFVLPSYREGTPRSVLEAMAMGRAIVTTDAPGCRETVIDGENGFLVPVKSVDALVDAMTRFIEDPDLAVRMGKRSREIAEEKYDVHKVNAVMLKEMGIK